MTGDVLPSWRDGAAKAAVVDFVRRVTTRGGADFLEPAERVATFDNDGTLWCEQPLQTQVFFAYSRLLAMAATDPSLRERQPFKAFLDRDMASLHEQGKRALFEVATATHAGMTEDAFADHIAKWLADARHPKLGKRFTELVYVPQLELLAYLRENGFKVFIVSGGGVDLIRSFSEAVYGIPRDQVVGSSVKLAYEDRDGVGQLVKLAELDSFDDREVKPANIGLHIGRRPVLAFGNSDGDLPMLHYARSGPGPRLALLLHHDDAEREFAYDRDFQLSPLADALDRADELGFQVVSMQRDWAQVFSS
jgi:phosphoserine phosphatase